MRYITANILKGRKRISHSHKGDYGRVLIVGGSIDFAGAPTLAALAAKAVLRSGADIVILSAPSSIAWAVNAICPDIITKKFKGDYFKLSHAKEIIKQAKKCDVVQIGCGIGRKSGSFIKKIIKIKAPKVIDADAIKAISLKDVDNAIITPHQKELEILMKNSKLKYSKDNNENIKKIRKIIRNNVILIKGPIDIVFSKNRLIKNKTGNAVMTKAGTGDVLAGLAAGFLAQTKDLFKSACMAAYINGKTGDYLLKKRGRTFIASDLVENLHEVYR